MSEITIVYTARRKLTSGTIVGDEKTISFELQSMDVSIHEDSSISEAIDGTSQETTFFINDRYRCKTISLSGADMLNVKEFLYSVKGGYTFTMTNPDENDAVMNCKLVGVFSREREGRLIGSFRYSFTVQDIDSID